MSTLPLPLVRVITGPVNGGKSTLLRHHLDRAERLGCSFGGFLTLPLWEKEGSRKSGFLLETLPGRSLVPIAGLTPAPGACRVGRFFLYREGVEAGLSSVLASLALDIVVLDEIGPAELSGDGHRQALDAALDGAKGEVWLSLRSSLLETFLGLCASHGRDIVVEQPLFRSQPRKPRNG
ncbi:nucleoside-triphosphatase [Sediminispirochaeta smaragdinae]|uniref:NTPase n=1 Tax=Sediminispirochaeta smaragdinae (strain DSM 11293 / JCM 15392 / SEBR 4228) TaxID=573413 RepID=E1R556_SEDSS|nr:nucleoside-triphosphatase [Sediminispirochaeta smaragdinae]ADK80591.1 hypothetical protein Spirs_1464 [Sediminispirochaeta smaragdinae DSM 11293]